MIRKWSIVLLAGIVMFTLAGLLNAEDNDNHQVTVQVQAINEVSVSGGNVTLTISTATAGSDPDDASYNSTCDLLWTTNEASKKITVVTSLASQNFTLKVLAQNVTGGSAAGQVTLSTTPSDFVTGVATTTGSCDLQYTATATAANGTGSDVHTVTYTITGS